MGAPIPDMQPADDVAAEVLLDSFKHIAAAERRRHATVLNYWLSIRGKRDFASIRDLDPLEISDAGPSSVLLEMIGGGEDADIRHIGQAIRAGGEVARVGEAPGGSLLACIAGKLPIVAATRQPYSFEAEFDGDRGVTRCWVTLLPFSSSGSFVDFVYGFVSLDPAPDGAADAPAEDEPAALDEQPGPEAAEAFGEPPAASEPEEVCEPAAEAAPAEAAEAHAEPEDSAPPRSGRPGFSKLFDALAGVGGFYGTNVKVEPNLPPLPADPEPEFDSQPEAQAEPEAKFEPEAEVESEPKPEAAAEPEPEPEPEAEAAAEAAPETEFEPEPQPVHQSHEREAEGPLQSKLAEVRAKAEEARMAKIRSNIALYEGLSAAYDFALDAEENAEEYLKLVEAQGLKIQLRSPMKPVVKLAFEGMCDDATIAQLEAVLAWALKSDLPRGGLARHLEEQGGIGAVLNGAGARAAA